MLRVSAGQAKRGYPLEESFSHFRVIHEQVYLMILPGPARKSLAGAGTGLAPRCCAENIALASLETFVHVNASALPLNRYLVHIEILDATWNATVVLSAASRSAGTRYRAAK